MWESRRAFCSPSGRGHTLGRCQGPDTRSTSTRGSEGTTIPFGPSSGELLLSAWLSPLRAPPHLSSGVATKASRVCSVLLCPHPLSFCHIIIQNEFFHQVRPRLKNSSALLTALWKKTRLPPGASGPSQVPLVLRPCGFFCLQGRLWPLGLLCLLGMVAHVVCGA